MSQNSKFTEHVREGGIKGPKSNVISPSNTPEENLKNLGGMPKSLYVDQVDKENLPKKAPGAVHGL